MASMNIVWFFTGTLLDKKAVDLKDVAVMTVNGNGETYFQKKQEKYEIFNLKGIMEND